MAGYNHPHPMLLHVMQMTKVVEHQHDWKVFKRLRKAVKAIRKKSCAKGVDGMKQQPPPSPLADQPSTATSAPTEETPEELVSGPVTVAVQTDTPFVHIQLRHGGETMQHRSEYDRGFAADESNRPSSQGRSSSQL